LVFKTSAFNRSATPPAAWIIECCWLSAETVRVLGLPSPRIAAHRVEIEARGPAEFAPRLRHVSVAGGDLPGPTSLDVVWDRAPCRAFEGAQHLEYRRTCSAPEVVDRQPWTRLQVFERGEMAEREVDHVDVVADSGAV